MDVRAQSDARQALTMKPARVINVGADLGPPASGAASRASTLTARQPTCSCSWLHPGHRPRLDQSCGFTLLEVLVGIAILAMAAVVLGAAYANTLGAHAAVAQRARTGDGMDYLREVIFNEAEREKVEQGGQLALPDGGQLHWEATIEEAAVPDLFKVVIRGRIAGGTAKEAEEFEHTSMLLRPAWSDSGKREQVRSDWTKLREKEKRR